MEGLDLYSGLIGAVIGGAIGIIGTAGVYWHSFKNAEQLQFRLRRADTIRSLVALRYCLQATYKASETDVAAFNQTMNAILFDFIDDERVVSIYRDFVKDPKDTNKLFELLDSMLGSEGIRRTITKEDLARAVSIKIEHGLGGDDG